MLIEIDFNSEEALYIQLRNRIILGIATNELKEGEALPSVRQLAEQSYERLLDTEQLAVGWENT